MVAAQTGRMGRETDSEATQFYPMMVQPVAAAKQAALAILLCQAKVKLVWAGLAAGARLLFDAAAFPSADS